MIEVPRGAVTAGEIATEAQFFSFGTNDLTQMISASAAHGGDAASVHFFESVGLDYVSASPYRIPADAPPRGTTGRPHRSLEPRWI